MTMPDETGTHELPDGTRGTVEQAAVAWRERVAALEAEVARLTAALAKAREEERAYIVAWLRADSVVMDHAVREPLRGSFTATAQRNAAKKIEALPPGGAK